MVNSPPKLTVNSAKPFPFSPSGEVMYSQEEVLSLVELIYGAAGDPARWIEVLQRLAAVFQGTVGTIHHQDTSSQDSNFSTLWGAGPEAIVPYVAYYGALNPLMTTRPQLIWTGSVNTSQMLCPEEIYLRSEYCQDYLRPLDLRDCIAATLRNEGANSSNLTIFRPTRGEPFGHEEREFLLALMPHLQRAFQLHTRIQGLECKASAAGDVLDQLQQAVVLLDAKGCVLLVNQAATALFASEKALKLTPRGLVAAISSENRQLNTLIQGAIATGTGDGLHSGGAMAVSRSGLHRPLQVLVAPLRTRMIYLGKDVSVVAVFVSDPEREPASNSAVLAQLFGLTRAESRLATILASGYTLKDAADQLCVAESTVRSQLKSIFAKTETNRQSELVRLLSLAPSRLTQTRNVDGLR